MGTTARSGQPWLRIVGLLAVSWLSIADPVVLIGVAFIELGLVLGARRAATLVGVVFALIVVLLPWGPWDGMGYMERAWALILGAWFAGLQIWRPEDRFTTRALGAVGGTAVTVAVILAFTPNAWGIVEQAVVERLSASVTGMLQLAPQQGQTTPGGFLATLNQVAQWAQTLFPALLGLASVGALGVATWAYKWLARDEGQAVGPLRDFRFNDHLVWVFVGGLVLLAPGWMSALSHVGANVVVFMGALYVLRGVAVVLFMTGGVSLIGALLLALGLLLLGPVLLAGAAIVGLGDTWLDIRSRTSKA